MQHLVHFHYWGVASKKAAVMVMAVPRIGETVEFFGNNVWPFPAGKYIVKEVRHSVAADGANTPITVELA